MHLHTSKVKPLFHLALYWGCSYLSMLGIQLKDDDIVGFIWVMTSSNENIFRVTGSLCGELTGHRRIPHTKASDAELWRFLWSAPECLTLATIVLQQVSVTAAGTCSWWCTLRTMIHPRTWRSWKGSSSTHWDRHKMTAIFQTAFLNEFYFNKNV